MSIQLLSIKAEKIYKQATHLPSVGENLQDHIDYVRTFSYELIDTIGFSTKSFLYKLPQELIKYIFTRKGQFASPEAGERTNHNNRRKSSGSNT